MPRGDGPAPVGEMSDDGSTWSKTIWIPTIDEADIELMPDEEGMTRQMAIKERAIAAAEQDLPAVTDTVRDHTQMQVCKNIFEGILRLNEFLAEQLGKAVQTAAEQVAAFEPAQVRAENVKSALDDVIEDHRRHLTDLRKADLRAERSLRAFAARNNRYAPADYKDDLLLPIAILLAMFVGESLINGLVLGQVSQTGIVGGVGMAAGISAINVLSGLAAGLYGWRYLFHVKPLFRVLGGTVVVVIHIAALIFNVMVAHFREAAELMLASGTFDSDMNRLGAEAVRHVATAPLSLGPASFGLLIIGLVIHAWSTREGWEDFADTYPGYRKRDVGYRRAHNAFADALEDVRDDARDAIESMKQSAGAAAARAEQVLRTTVELKSLAQQRYQEVLGSEDTWVVTGNRILKLYRDENLKVRDEGPAYFDEFPSAEKYRTGNFGVGLERSSEIRSQEATVKAHMKALDLLIARARKAAKEAASISAATDQSVQQQLRTLGEELKLREAQITKTARKEIDDDPKPQAAS